MVKSLTGLMGLSKTANILIEEFAQRERHRGRSDLRKMFKQLEEEHKDLNKDDFMVVFENLQSLGFGSIIYGRGPNPTRFVWNYNLKDIGLAAKGKISEDQIHSIDPNGEAFKPKSTGGASIPSFRAPEKPMQPITNTGEALEVIVISKSTGGVSRFLVSPERAELINKLLSEFASQI